MEKPINLYLAIRASTKSIRKLLGCVLTFMMLTTQASADTTVIPEVDLHSKHTDLSNTAAPVQTTQITRQTITQSPVLNLTDIFQQEQSIVRITNSTGDNSQTALSIRGFGDNAVANTLILVDGFPLTNPTLLAPNFNSIALSDIERIDIFQGSEGTLWGNQAVGGVVNIITRHPEKFMGDINAGIGSYHQYFYSGLVGSKFTNGFFFKAFGYKGDTDNYRQHNDQSDDNVSVQLGDDYARGTFSVNVQSYGDTVYFPGGLNLGQFNANPQQASNFTSYSDMKNDVYQVLSKHELTDNWILETRVLHHDVDGTGFIFSAFNNDEWDNYLNPRLVGSIKNNKVIIGYVGENSNYYLSNSRVQSEAYASENDLYAQVVVPIIHQLDLTLGGRGAWQDNNAEKIIGQSIYSDNRAVVSEQGLAFHPNANWNMFLRRDGNFRFPKANEAIWTPYGVPALLPQTGVSYEAGVGWNTERNQSQLSVYRLQLHDEIAFDPTQTANEPFGSFQNFNNTLRRGVTVTESYLATQKLTLNSQLNYVAARLASGVDSGKWIPAVPAFNANAGLTYQLSQHWRTKYNAIYTGSQYASEDIANSGNKQPGYWLNSVAIQYILYAAEISFEVDNVFNQQYSAYTLFDPTSHTDTFYPGTGRDYLLTLKANIA